MSKFIHSGGQCLSMPYSNVPQPYPQVSQDDISKTGIIEAIIKLVQLHQQNNLDEFTIEIMGVKITRG